MTAEPTDPPSPTQQRVDAQMERPVDHNKRVEERLRTSDHAAAISYQDELEQMLQRAEAERDEARAERDRLAADNLRLTEDRDRWRAAYGAELEARSRRGILLREARPTLEAALDQTKPGTWNRKYHEERLARIDAALAGSGVRPAEEVEK